MLDVFNSLNASTPLILPARFAKIGVQIRLLGEAAASAPGIRSSQ